MANLRKNGKYSKVQHCSECNKRVQAMMEIGNEADDWFWPECYECGDIICPECRCEHEEEIYCTTCYCGIALKS